MKHMPRVVLFSCVTLLLGFPAGLSAADVQPPIAITAYVIDAQVNPATHTLSAQTRVTFTANQASDAAIFELHGALQITQVLDGSGAALNGERGANATVRVTPPQPLVAGQTYTWTFVYAGALTAADGGPVDGLKLASVNDPISYLLYAGRWFPMVGYTTDRFTAEMHVFVPAGYTVIGSGETRGAGEKSITVSAEQAHREAELPAGQQAGGEPQLRRRGDAAGEAETTATEARKKAGTSADAATTEDATGAYRSPAAPVPGSTSASKAKNTAKTGTAAKTAASAHAHRANRAGAGAKTAAKTAAAADKATAGTGNAAGGASAGTTGLASMALPGGREFDFSWTKPGFPGTLIIGKFLPPVTEAGSPNIRVYTTEAHKASAAAYADTANREFAFFTSTFGFPESSHLNVVELPDDTVPAYWSPEIAAIAGSRLSNKSDFRLLANTMAHQWWGSEVSPATLNDTWISNGMARYGELLYLEDLEGKAALQNAVLDVSAGALAYDTIPLTSAQRLAVFSPEFQSMTLEKGAMVFHMLRWEVGDDSFLKILRGAISQYMDKGMSTRQFETIAEAQSQQQLTAFFSQWLDGTGAPNFVDKYAVYRLGNDKGFRTIGEIDQDLDLFNMPVDLRVETQGNTEDKRVQVEGTSSQYVVDTFGSPRHIQIDPDNWILKNSPDMEVRIAILRGQQLVGEGDLAGALVEYQKALAANPASSLASYRIGDLLFTQRNYQSAANAYRDALRGDAEPAWTQVWSHIALGNIFDATGQRDRAINEYRLALQTNDNTQGALNQARAYLKAAYKVPDSQ
jgi:predicted negative regulator of RcsB-dependent stress response